MIAQKGYSGAVIAAFHEYAQGDIDLSLLRYFLSEFLRMVVPPFEPSFCRQMMDLLALPSSQQAMDRPTYRPLVAAFSGVYVYVRGGESEESVHIMFLDDPMYGRTTANGTLFPPPSTPCRASGAAAAAAKSAGSCTSQGMRNALWISPSYLCPLPHCLSYVVYLQ